MEERDLRREVVAKTRRAVVKVGSSLLVSLREGLRRRYFHDLAAQIGGLRRRGVEVLLVSSGAIAAGMERLGLKKRPTSISELQATAAVGQGFLMHIYEEAFGPWGLKVGQVLLTHEDVRDRKRYLNARSTLLTLLRLGIVPIINENDSVAVEEIKFGDNDTLAALAAGLTDCQLLVILTDVEGLYLGGPQKGKLLTLVEKVDAKLELAVKGTDKEVSIGGMETKIKAVKLASKAGIFTIVADGRDTAVIERIWQGEVVGTLFTPERERLKGKKKWIGFNIRPRGVLVVDKGAMKAILEGGKSLLPSGIEQVQGAFSRGDVVLCRGPEGQDFAKGLVNYSSEEIEAIRGHKSGDIADILGYKYADEVIHRDNLVLL